MSSEYPEIWEGGIFTIDHFHKVNGYSLPGGPVGFLKPSFEKDELISFLKVAYPDLTIDYYPELDTLHIPKKVKEAWSNMDHEEFRGFDAMTGDGLKHLYTIDSWNWPWEAVIDNKALCGCGHAREEHNLLGIGDCRRCYCRQYHERLDT